MRILSEKICLIEDCHIPALTRGWCSKHYKRFTVWGDPLITKKHGFSNTVEYKTLKNMKDRCYKPYSNLYKYYGARGIKVCDRWLGKDGIVNFIADMGFKPSSNLSIDRIDNDGDYTPTNCRWADSSTQNKNRRKFTRTKKAML